MIFLMIGGAGLLKLVFTPGHLNSELARIFGPLFLHPLILRWLIATVIRVSPGSATIAGLTTAGIIAYAAARRQVCPSLTVPVLYVLI